MILYLTTVILEAKLKWSSVFKVLREDEYPSIFPYLATMPC